MDNSENELAKKLFFSKSFPKTIISPNEVVEKAEFRLLKIIWENPDISSKEVFQIFNPERYLLEKLYKLMQADLISQNEDGNWSVIADIDLPMKKFAKEDQLESPLNSEIKEEIKTDTLDRDTSEFPEKTSSTGKEQEEFSDIEIEPISVEIPIDQDNEPDVPSADHEALPDPQSNTEEVKEHQREKKIIDEQQFEYKPQKDQRDRMMEKFKRETRSDKPRKEQQSEDFDIDALFDEVLETSMEDFVSDFEQLEIIDEESGRPKLDELIIEILQTQGYITEDSIVDEHDTIPEFEIMKIIIENHPIGTSEIENNATVSSVSLTLSNLQADDLIVQTNDYRWTVSQKTLGIIKEFLKEQKFDLMQGEKVSNKFDIIDNYIDKMSKSEPQLISAGIALDFIRISSREIEDLLQIPEFEILRIIKLHEPVSEEKIREHAEHTIPVVITRMISKLQARELIFKNAEDLWSLTPKFKFILTKDRLKENLEPEEYDELESELAL